MFEIMLATLASPSARPDLNPLGKDLNPFRVGFAFLVQITDVKRPRLFG
jgi:hypothetical protein